VDHISHRYYLCFQVFHHIIIYKTRISSPPVCKDDFSDRPSSLTQILDLLLLTHNGRALLLDDIVALEVPHQVQNPMRLRGRFGFATRRPTAIPLRTLRAKAFDLGPKTGILSHQIRLENARHGF